MKNILLILFLSISYASFSQVTTSEKPVSGTEVEMKENEDANIEVPFSIIERVPVYPGCDGTKSNKELKECMTEKIRKHVAKKFNIDVADSLGLEGKQRIIAAFKIDKEGKIIDVRTRAQHPILAKEAERVVKLIPQMESPGIQRGKPVTVPYSLPIQYYIVPDTKPETKKEKRRKKKEEMMKKVKKN